MKRKYTGIILAVLIITFIIPFSIISCKQVGLETTTTATTSIETTSATSTTTVSTKTETTPTQVPQQIIYTNTQYGFNFLLPLSWEGYQIIESKWEANPQENIIAEQGPIVSIRHPKWTLENPRQDIPIMVFTYAQWDSLQQERFHVSAAPIDPSELGRNTKYVFALPARYNYAFLTGWEEVEKILEHNPLKAF
jgi:hypothetical protein